MRLAENPRLAAIVSARFVGPALALAYQGGAHAEAHVQTGDTGPGGLLAVGLLACSLRLELLLRRYLLWPALHRCAKRD